VCDATHRELRFRSETPANQGALSLDRSFCCGQRAALSADWGRSSASLARYYYKCSPMWLALRSTTCVRLRYQANNNAGHCRRLRCAVVAGSSPAVVVQPGRAPDRENLVGDSLNVFDSRVRFGRQSKTYPPPLLISAEPGHFLRDNLPDDYSVRLREFRHRPALQPPTRPICAARTALFRAYRRADLGFTKVVSLRECRLAARGRSVQLQTALVEPGSAQRARHANNLAGYNYVQDLNGLTYSVPNFLSNRPGKPAGGTPLLASQVPVVKRTRHAEA
jgi:hypothetical protein